ncbi:hypothetical protein BC833DRAFT_620140 [Globomyces pollinis-pini]|nr:hypothetical protein BC833DRAFT_620140 [Globomyces pollinis-pini]
MEVFYIRVKHQKTTLFVTAKPNESIYKVKVHLSQLLAKQKEPKQIRLLLPSKTSGYTTLENNSTLEQLGLVNDSVVYMVYQDETADGGFEAVAVPEFDPLYSDIPDSPEKK